MQFLRQRCLDVSVLSVLTCFTDITNKCSQEAFRNSIVDLKPRGFRIIVTLVRIHGKISDQIKIAQGVRRGVSYWPFIQFILSSECLWNINLKIFGFNKTTTKSRSVFNVKWFDVENFGLTRNVRFPKTLNLGENSIEGYI